MRAHIKLFEFLAELIDVQIKKYKALAKFGVGPDAGPNALLVANEVCSLLEIAHKLDKEMHRRDQGQDPDLSILPDAFNQIYFYIKMEHLRAHAGWLVDSNNIHTPVYDRVVEQKAALDNMAEEFDFHYDENFKKDSDQQQCEYDSHAIAHKILSFVIDLKQNPAMEFPAGTPPHVERILRKHIKPGGRYHQDDIWSQVQELHTPCKEYIDANPTLTQTVEFLPAEYAKLLRNGHKKELSELLESFKKLCPDSVLFSPEHKWYTVKFEEHDEPRIGSVASAASTSVRNPYALYAGVGLSLAVAVGMFIYNLANSGDENKATPGVSW